MHTNNSTYVGFHLVFLKLLLISSFAIKSAQCVNVRFGAKLNSSIHILFIPIVYIHSCKLLTILICTYLMSFGDFDVRQFK